MPRWEASTRSDQPPRADRHAQFWIRTAPAQVAYDDILRVRREADGIEQIEHAWLFDHLMPLGGWIAVEHQGPGKPGRVVMGTLGRPQRAGLPLAQRRSRA
ncbi:hypothetical protein ACIGXI_26350 [Kitasatospora aureofaciens]|uniref:hypothetical protein n=1 Tax=Kitasatospora aureofaciens TaxID=1894 RepID=UPI0037CBBB60